MKMFAHVQVSSIASIRLSMGFPRYLHFILLFCNRDLQVQGHGLNRKALHKFLSNNNSNSNFVFIGTLKHYGMVPNQRLCIFLFKNNCNFVSNKNHFKDIDTFLF